MGGFRHGVVVLDFFISLGSQSFVWYTACTHVYIFPAMNAESDMFNTSCVSTPALSSSKLSHELKYNMHTLSTYLTYSGQNEG